MKDLASPISSQTTQLSAPSSKSKDYAPNDWRFQIKRTKQYVLIANEINVATILTHAPEFKGKICQDVFAKATMIKGPMPWKRLNTPIWQEDDDLQLLGWLQKRGMTKIKPDIVQRGVKLAALDAQINPILDYLNSLSWDGIPRLDNWLTAYMGADPSGYAKAIAPKVLISAVARVFEPGCKVDTVLILEGDQGTYKSTAIKVLFGEDHTTDHLPDLNTKDAAIQLQGQWVVEVAELSALNRSETNKAKEFMAQASDKYRAPYGTDSLKRPRSCIFIATTNDETYLKDPTGARRYWPIKCAQANLKALRQDRDQLWAEAVTRYKNGEAWHLTHLEEQLAKDAQDARYAEDPWAAQIDLILEAVATGDLSALNQNPTWQIIHPKLEKGKITNGQIAQIIGLRTQDQDMLSQKRIAAHLKHRKWDAKKSGSRRWYKPPEDWNQNQEGQDVATSDDNLQDFLDFFEGTDRAASMPSPKPNLDPSRFPADMTLEEAMQWSDDQTPITEDLIFTARQQADIFQSASLLHNLISQNPQPH